MVADSACQSLQGVHRTTAGRTLVMPGKKFVQTIRVECFGAARSETDQLSGKKLLAAKEATIRLGRAAAPREKNRVRDDLITRGEDAADRSPACRRTPGCEAVREREEPSSRTPTVRKIAPRIERGLKRELTSFRAESRESRGRNRRLRSGRRRHLVSSTTSQSLHATNHPNRNRWSNERAYDMVRMQSHQRHNTPDITW
jgi:hypothetical protein